MPRSRAAAVLLLPLLVTACKKSSGTSTEAQALAEEARALRAEMFEAGLTAMRVEPPTVSDELFRLGQALFFDKILSGGLDVSCATCHLPQFASGDGRNLSRGVHGIGLGPDRGEGVMIPRNSPALFALHLKPELFWDGRIRRIDGVIFPPQAVSLSAEMRAALSPRLDVMGAQAMLPPVSREEMRGMEGDNPIGDLGDGYNSPGGSVDHTEDVWEVLTSRLLNSTAYLNLLRDAYPEVEVQDFNFAHAGNAIAAFEANAFARTDSPFDRFMRGDDLALTADQLRGGAEFLRAGCADCHTGPLLSDLRYHNTGLPQLGPGTNGPDTLPAVGGRPDFGRENATLLPADRYRFRTASLLNVELTGPYGHAGQFEELRDFVEHYRDVRRSNLEYDLLANIHDPALVNMQVGNSEEVLAGLDPRLAEPLELDVDAIMTFLLTLTDEDARDMSDIVPTFVPSGLPVF